MGLDGMDDGFPERLLEKVEGWGIWKGQWLFSWAALARQFQRAMQAETKQKHVVYESNSNVND